MLRGIFSFAVAVLITGTMLWGQCAGCPLIPAQQTAPAGHDCCTPPSQSDDCHAPSGKHNPQCPGEAFAQQSWVKSDNTTAVAPLPAVVAEPIEPAVPVFRPAAPVPEPLLYGPPDLYLSNSVLLI